MDTAAILVKLAGLALFAFTARSVYKHFKTKSAAKRSASGANAGAAEQQSSNVERALNAFLLYAWFVFMTAFSLGMVLNN